jgi:hypothetical protein
LLQAASELKITADNDDEAIDELISAKISTPEADTDTCKRYYEQHKEKFKDKKSGKTLGFSLVEGHIRDYLNDKAIRVALSSYIEKLSKEAKIAGFELQ